MVSTCQCNSAVISAKLCRHQHQTRVITCLIITCLIISGHLLDSPFIQSKIFSDLFNGSSKLREQMIKTITFAHTCNVQIGMTNTTVLMCNTKPSTCWPKSSTIHIQCSTQNIYFIGLHVTFNPWPAVIKRACKTTDKCPTVQRAKHKCMITSCMHICVSHVSSSIRHVRICAYAAYNRLNHPLKVVKLKNENHCSLISRIFPYISGTVCMVSLYLAWVLYFISVKMLRIVY